MDSLVDGTSGSLLYPVASFNKSNTSIIVLLRILSLGSSSIDKASSSLDAAARNNFLDLLFDPEYFASTPSFFKDRDFLSKESWVLSSSN